jgi:hypothetical protein
MTISKKFIGVICITLILIFPCFAYTQTVPAGNLLDEQLQLNSLLADSLTPALINRPVSLDLYKSVLENNQNLSGWWSRDLFPKPIFAKQGVRIGLLPIELQQTYNSRIPYGENNGAAWYGRGSNIDFKGGLYIASNYLTLNFNPQIVYQENTDFLIPRFIPGDGQGGVRYIAEGIGTAIDAPFRFGPDPFTTYDLGNSSIRIHKNNLETGLSTEPLWWGPAVRYPLVFSNNAAGIPHFFLGSRTPLTIPYFGDVQFKWIWGYPQDSEYYDGPRADITRFTNAINLAYTPVFFKNLTLGLTRVYHMIETGGFSLNNVTLIFKPGAQQDAVDPSQGGDITQDRNQLVSLYAHLRLPEARAEIYAEFLREDRSYDVRDFVNQPHHNSAYTIGFQKISDLPWIDFLKTNFEFSNLTTTQLEQVRPQTYIYTHSKIRQGHTNHGQILGAAIGPGSNSQFLAFDAYKNNYKFGVFAQRWVDNENFHFERGSKSISPSRNFGDYFRHRVNLNLGLNLLYGPGPFYLSGKLMWTKAYNYGRFNYGEFDGVSIRNYEYRDLVNIQFQMGLTYIF